jgi:hypothetical protein
MPLLKQLIYSTIVSILFAGCNPINNKTVLTENIDSLAVPQDSNAIYFPFPNYNDSELKNNRKSWDAFVFTWYSKMLFALHEPVLSNYKGENEIYRFTLLRSFDHPLTVRLQKQGENISLISKITSGSGGYEPGYIIWDTTFNLELAQMDTLNSLVEKAMFWNMPTQVNDGGDDGAEWILEAVRDGRYHWVSRWSPSPARYLAFKNACEYLLRISKSSLISKQIH